MNDLANLIESQLRALGAFLKASNWYGRENELVNLFAHSFLGKAIDPARIGIEVAVKQVQGEGTKELVRKDLVIWEKPNQTVWDNGVPANDPAAVIEFKVNNEAKCKPDVEWLRAFTGGRDGVLGIPSAVM